MITFVPTVETDWSALSADGRLLLLTGSAPAEITSAVRASFSAAVTIPVLLDALLQSGLASAPDFVLLEWTATVEGLHDVRVLVRGEADLEVRTDDGVNTVTGRGVSTWSEQSFPAASELAVIVAGGRWVVAGGGAAASPKPLTTKAAASKAAAPAKSAVADTPSATEKGAQNGTDKNSQKATLGGAAAVLADGAPAGAAAVAAAVPVPAAAPAQAAPVAASTAPPAPPVPPASATLPDTEATIIPRPAGADAPAAPSAPDDDAGYDHLFGDTVFVTVSGAAVREPAVEEAAAAVPAPGDHDGHTVLTSDIAAMRASRPQGAAAPAAPHGGSVAQRVVLAFSGGSTEVLDRPIIVGRSPSASKVSGNDVPKLVTIGGDDPDISRSHARFAIEGGTVVVTDLNSRNGTLVTLPGKSPQRLRGGEPTSVISGTLVDLGGGILLTVRED